eukprot:1582299-Prymnesium_polylepis.1
MSTSRMVSAMNGTIVSSIAGQGSEFLFHLMREGAQHSQVGLVYASWLQHVASVGMSNMKIESTDGGTTYSVNYKGDDLEAERNKEIFQASDMIQEYAKAAWDARNVLEYKPSPMLTKSVFKDPVGVEGKGYALLHDIVERDQPYSLETLECLYMQAIKTVLSADANNVDNSITKMLDDTANRGSANAKAYGRTVATATSLVVNYLISYRCDGRNLVTVKGIDFA